MTPLEFGVYIMIGVIVVITLFVLNETSKNAKK